jgi:dTDP-4-dehydrorhamnose reductase
VTFLVIGAGGQLGHALMRQAPVEASVIGWSRAELDLRSVGAIAEAIAALAPTTIINAAAYTAVDQAESDSQTAFAINCDAAGAIAAAAAQIGARMVHVSTDFVFDGTNSTPYLPGATRAPLGVYGASKAAGEDVVLRECAKALVVRTAWVYGAGGRNFVETMLRLMTVRDTLSVVADQIGTPTHAASLARALWRLASGPLTGVHHFTDAGVASWYDFAVAIHDIGRKRGVLANDVSILPIATADYPTPARRPAYSVLDKVSTWAALGVPAAHWRAELEHMFLERENLNGG